MIDRVQFITHQGKQILLIDLSNCSPDNVDKIVRTVPDLVATHPLGSVLILSDFTGASFGEEAIRVLQETAVFDKPFGYPFCRGRIFLSIEEDTGQYDDVTEIFWATGACMFVK